MVTAGIVYDKYSVIQKLQKRGFTHDQAEGIAEVLAEPDTSTLATKTDLQEMKVSLIQWMIGIQLAYGAIIVTVVALL